jgi:hypothetical protein
MQGEDEFVPRLYHRLNDQWKIVQDALLITLLVSDRLRESEFATYMTLIPLADPDTLPRASEYIRTRLPSFLAFLKGMEETVPDFPDLAQVDAALHTLHVFHVACLRIARGSTPAVEPPDTYVHATVRTEAARLDQTRSPYLLAARFLHPVLDRLMNLLWDSRDRSHILAEHLRIRLFIGGSSRRPVQSLHHAGLDTMHIRPF